MLMPIIILLTHLYGVITPVIVVVIVLILLVSVYMQVVGYFLMMVVFVRLVLGIIMVLVIAPIIRFLKIIVVAGLRLMICTIFCMLQIALLRLVILRHHWILVISFKNIILVVRRYGIRLLLQWLVLFLRWLIGIEIHIRLRGIFLLVVLLIL